MGRERFATKWAPVIMMVPVHVCGSSGAGAACWSRSACGLVSSRGAHHALPCKQTTLSQVWGSLLIVLRNRCADILLRIECRVHTLVKDRKAATCRVMPWASAAGASVGGGVAIAASPVSMLPQVQVGLSTDATRSIAIADMPSAARIIGPGAAHPRGPLPTLCTPRVTSRAAPPDVRHASDTQELKKEHRMSYMHIYLSHLGTAIHPSFSGQT